MHATAACRQPCAFWISAPPVRSVACALGLAFESPFEVFARPRRTAAIPHPCHARTRNHPKRSEAVGYEMPATVGFLPDWPDQRSARNRAVTVS